MTTFGNYIKEEREKKSWTQTDFGAKIGINSSAISRIEKGTKQLSPAKLSLISELFNVKLDFLKELYYGDKFAKEAFNNGCKDNVFNTAEKALLYLKNKATKQSRLTF
jgi:transcriptional regulator with XRE-family HTH domain